MPNFDRSYLLKISSPTKLLADPSKPYNLSVADTWTDTPVSVDTGIVNQIETIEITDLRVKAKISATTSNSNTNYTEVMIYNAPKLLKDQLQLNDSYLSLSAGYSRDIFTGEVFSKGDLPLLFVGDIVESSTKKVGENYITTVKAKDSEVMTRDAYISRTYFGDTLIKDIVRDMVTNFMPKVSIGRIDIDLLPIISKLNYPYVAYGKVSDVLNELAEDFGFKWYITANRFYATLPNIGKVIEVIYIDRSNVIGDVEQANSSNNTQDPTKVKAGVKFRVFLDGRIDTSKVVRISGFTDTFKNGDFKIVDVAHILDSRGESWFTEITAEGV